VKQDLLNSILALLSVETLEWLLDEEQEFLKRLDDTRLSILLGMLQSASLTTITDCEQTLIEVTTAIQDGTKHKTKAVQDFAAHLLAILIPDADEAPTAVDYDEFDEDDDYVPES
jgi:hypothetical protein